MKYLKQFVENDIIKIFGVTKVVFMFLLPSQNFMKALILNKHYIQILVKIFICFLVSASPLPLKKTLPKKLLFRFGTKRKINLQMQTTKGNYCLMLIYIITLYSNHPNICLSEILYDWTMFNLIFSIFLLKQETLFFVFIYEMLKKQREFF